jgi:hypothetical protein
MENVFIEKGLLIDLAPDIVNTANRKLVIESGIQFKIMFNPICLGYLGYISIPKSNKFFKFFKFLENLESPEIEKDSLLYDKLSEFTVNDSFSRELTYSGFLPGDEEFGVTESKTSPNQLYSFGFDCCHYNDKPNIALAKELGVYEEWFNIHPIVHDVQLRENTLEDIKKELYSLGVNIIAIAITFSKEYDSKMVENDIINSFIKATEYLSTSFTGRRAILESYIQSKDYIDQTIYGNILEEFNLGLGPKKVFDKRSLRWR